MKKLLLSITLVLFFNILFAQNNWIKVWSEEFNYEGLPNPKIWRYDVGGDGWGNQELQFYTLNKKENARVEDGHLIIEAKKEDLETNKYTSARLKTLGAGDWKNGKIEVKAKIPQGRGIWSAIWLLPTEKKYGSWPKSGEIDILEHVGFDPNTIYSTIHTENYNHKLGTQIGSHTTIEKPFDDFHLYGLEWFEDSIIFLLDSNKFYKVERKSENPADWPFDQKFHLLLNIAIGGTWGGSKGIDTTIFPQKMLVDYIRVYKSTEDKEAYNFTLYQTSGGTATATNENGENPKNTLITVEADPIEDYTFLGWEGTLQSSENPFTFPLNLDINLSPHYRKKNELIVNGDFHLGFMNWKEHNYTNNGKNSSKDQKACFELPEKATYSWDAQLSQTNLNFKEGAKYELSFFASSTSSETLTVSSGLSHEPWTTYFTEQFTLTEELKIYKKEFIVEKKLSENDRLTFDLGNLKGLTCLDNISLLLVESTLSAETKEKKEVPMFKIFPTKIDGTTTIMTVAAIKDITVVTETGGKVNQSRYTVEVISSRLAKIKWSSDLKSGVYLVKTQTENGIHIDKLVKD